MRFLSMVKIDWDNPCQPTEKLMADMGRLIEEMTREGTLVQTAGLKPAAEGVQVRLNKGGRISVTDGPYAEAKEVVGGYAILEAKSKAHAIELTRRFLKVHGDDWDVSCEVRELESGC